METQIWLPFLDIKGKGISHNSPNPVYFKNHDEVIFDDIVETFSIGRCVIDQLGNDNDYKHYGIITSENELNEEWFIQFETEDKPNMFRFTAIYLSNKPFEGEEEKRLKDFLK